MTWLSANRMFFSSACSPRRVNPARAFPGIALVLFLIFVARPIAACFAFGHPIQRDETPSSPGSDLGASRFSRHCRLCRPAGGQTSSPRLRGSPRSLFLQAGLSVRGSRLGLIIPRHRPVERWSSSVPAPRTTNLWSSRRADSPVRAATHAAWARPSPRRPQSPSFPQTGGIRGGHLVYPHRAAQHQSLDRCCASPAESRSTTRISSANSKSTRSHPRRSGAALASSRPAIRQPRSECSVFASAACRGRERCRSDFERFVAPRRAPVPVAGLAWHTIPAPALPLAV